MLSNSEWTTKEALKVCSLSDVHGVHALAVFSFFVFFYACRNNYRKSDRERERDRQYTNIEKSGQESTSILFSHKTLVFLDCHTAESKSSHSGQTTTTHTQNTHGGTDRGTDRGGQTRTKARTGEDKGQATLLNPLAPHLAGLALRANFFFPLTYQHARPFFSSYGSSHGLYSVNLPFFFFFHPLICYYSKGPHG